MKKTVPELLDTVSGLDLVLAVLLLIAVAMLIYMNWGKISKPIYDRFRSKEESQRLKKDLAALQCSAEEFKKDMREYQTNREKDREVSRKIRDQLSENIAQNTEVLNSIVKTVNDMSKSVEELKDNINQINKENAKMREINKISKRTDLKSKIEKLYRECSPYQTCTDMQFETLKELIEDYERQGGDNSFVHTIVQKEMYKWKIVDITGGNK